MSSNDRGRSQSPTRGSGFSSSHHQDNNNTAGRRGSSVVHVGGGAMPVTNQSQLSVSSGVAPTHVLDGKVRCMEPVDHGRMVWTGEADGAVHIRAMPGGHETRVLDRRFKTFVNAMCYVEESHTVWVGHSDGFIRIHSASNGDLIKEVVHHDGPVYTMLYHEGFVYSGGGDWKVFQWKPASMGYSRMYNGHTNNVRDLAGSLSVADTTSTTTTAGGVESSATAGGAQGSGGGQGWIFSAGDDATIRAWDPFAPTYSEAVDEKKREQRRTQSPSPQGSGPYSPSASDPAITALTASCMHTFKGHSRSVLCVACVDSKAQLWSGAEDNTIRVWDMNSLECKVSLDHRHKAPITSLTVVDDRVWSGGKDGVMFIWDTKTITPISQLPGGLQLSSSYVSTVRRLQRSYIWKVWSCTSEGLIQCWNAERAPTQVEIDAEGDPSASDHVHVSREEMQLNVQRVKNLQTALYENVSKLKAKDDQIKDLEHRLEMLQAPHQHEEMEQLHNQLDAAYAEQEELRRDNDNLKEQCQLAERVMSVTKATLGTTSKKLDEALDERDGLVDQVEVLTQERDDLKKTVAEQEELLKDQLSIREAHDSLMEKNEELEKSLADLRDEQSTKQQTDDPTTPTRVSTTNTASSPIAASPSTADGETSKANGKQVEELLRENDRLAEENMALKKTNRALEEDVERLQNSFEQMEQIRAENQSLKDSLARNSRSASRGASPLQDSTPTVAARQIPATASQSGAAESDRVKQLERDLASLNREFEEFRSDSSDRHRELERQNDLLRGMNRSNEDELTSKNQEISNLRKERQKLIKELKEQDAARVASPRSPKAGAEPSEPSTSQQGSTVGDTTQHLLTQLQRKYDELRYDAEQQDLEASRRIQELERSSQVLKDDNRALEEELSASRREIGELRKERKSLVDDLAAAQDEAHASKVASDSELKRTVRTLKDENASLEEELETSKREVVSLRSERKQLIESQNEALSSRAASDTTADDLERNIRTLRADNNALEEELADSKREVVELRKERKKLLGDLASAHDAAHSSDVAASVESRQAQAARQQDKQLIAILQEDRDKLHNRNESLEIEISTLKGRLKDREDELQTLTSSKKSAQGDLEDDLAQEKSERRRLEKKLEMSSEALEKFKKEQNKLIRELEEERDDYKALLSKQQKKAAQDQNTSDDDSAATIAKLVEERRKLNENLRNVMADLDSAESRERDAIRQHSSLKDELRTSQADHRALQDQFEKLQNECDKLNKEVNRLEKEVEDRPVPVAAPREVATSSTSRGLEVSDSGEPSMAQQQVKIDQLQEDLRSAESKATQAEDRASRAEERATRAEGSVVAANDKCSKAEEKATAAEDRCNRTEEKVSRLEQDLLHANTRANKAEERVAVCEERLRNMERQGERNDDEVTRTITKINRLEDDLKSTQAKQATAEDDAKQANLRAAQSEAKIELLQEKSKMANDRASSAEEKAGVAEGRQRDAEEKRREAEQKLIVSEEKVRQAEEKLQRSENQREIAERKSRESEEKCSAAEKSALLAEEKAKLADASLRAAEQRTETGEKSSKAAEDRVALAERQRIVAEEQVKGANEKATAAEIRAAAADERVQAVSEKLAISEQRAAVSEEKVKTISDKLAACESRAAAAEEKTKAAEERVAVSEKATLVADEKTKAAQEKAVAAEDRAVQAEKKVVTAEEKASLAEQKATQFEEKAKSLATKSESSEDKAFSAEEKTRLANQEKAQADERAARAEQKVAAFEARVEEMDRARNQREKQFEALEERLRSTEAKAAVTEQKLEASLKHAEDQSKKLEDSEKKCGASEQKVAATEARLDESKATISQKSKDLEQREKEYSASLADLKESHKEEQRAQDRKFQDCEAEKNDALRTINRQQQQLEDLGNSTEELRGSIKELQLKLDDAHSTDAEQKQEIGRLTERSNRLDVVEREATELSEKISTLSRELQQRTTERDEAREMNEKLDQAHQDLQTKYGTLEKKQTTTEETRGDLQRQLDVMTVQYNEAEKRFQDTNSQKAELETQLGSLHEKRTELEQECSRLTERLKQIDVLEKELEEEKARHNELKNVTVPEIEEAYQQRISKLEGDNAQLLELSNTANLTMKTQHATIDELNNRIAQLELDLASTSERASQSEQEVAALKTEVARLKEDVAEEKTRYSALEREKRRSEARLSDTSDELTKTKTQLENTQTELLETQEEKAEKEAELKGSQDTNESLRSELSRSQADGESKAEVIASLHQVIDERNESLEALNTSLKVNAEELTETKTNLAESQMLCTETQSKLEAMTERKEALTKELESYHRMAETLAERDYLIEQQKQEISERDDKITDLKQRLPPLEKQIADLEAQNRELEGVNEKLSSTQQELDRMTKEMEELARQRDGFESDANEGKSFVRQASELRVRVSELEAENQRIRTESLEFAQGARERETNLEESNATLKSDNVALAKEQVELITRVKAAEDGASALGEVREHLLQARHTNEVLKQELAGVQDENKALEARLVQYGPTGQVNHEGQMKELEAVVKEKSELLSEQAKTIEALQGVHQEDTSLVESLLAANAGDLDGTNRAKEIAAFTAKMDSLDAALDRSERYERHQEREIDELNARIDILENALTTAIPFGPSPASSMLGKSSSAAQVQQPQSPGRPKSPSRPSGASSSSVGAGSNPPNGTSTSLIVAPQPQPTEQQKVGSFVAVKNYLDHLSRLVSQKNSVIHELRQSNDERGSVIETLRKKVVGLAASRTGSAATNGADGDGRQDLSPVVSEELRTQLSLTRRSNDYLQFEVGRLQRLLDLMETAAREKKSDVVTAGGSKSASQEHALFSPQTRSLLEHYSNTVKELREQLDASQAKERHLRHLIATQAKQLMGAEALSESEESAQATRNQMLQKAEEDSRSLAAAQSKITALTEALVRCEEALLPEPAASTRSEHRSAVVVVDNDSTTTRKTSTDQPRLLPLLDRMEEKDRLLTEAEARASSFADELALLQTQMEGSSDQSQTFKRTMEEQEYSLARLEGKLLTATDELSESRQKVDILKLDLKELKGQLERYETKEKELDIWLKANEYDLSLQLEKPEARSLPTDSSSHKTPALRALLLSVDSDEGSPATSSDDKVLVDERRFDDIKLKLRELHFKYEDAVYHRVEAEKQRDRLQQSFAKSQGDVHEMEQTVAEQKREVATAYQARDDSQMELKKSTLEVRELNEDLKKAKAEIQATRDDSDTVLVERDQLRVEQNDLKEDLIKTKEQLANIESSLIEKSNKLAVMQEELNSKVADLESKKSFIQEMEQTNLATRQNFDRREEVIKGIEEQASQLQAQNEELSSRVYSLQKERSMLAEKLQAEEDGHVASRVRLEKHIAELESNHEPLREQAAQAKEHVAESERKVQDLEFELSQARSDYQSIAKQCAFASETVRQQNAKIDALEQASSDSSSRALKDDELTRALARLCHTFGLKPTGRETEPSEFIMVLSSWEDIEVDRLLRLNGLVESLNELIARFPAASPVSEASPSMARNRSLSPITPEADTSAAETNNSSVHSVWSTSYRARLSQAFNRLDSAFAKMNTVATKCIRSYDEERSKAQTRQLKITEMLTQGRAEKERWMETREQLDQMMAHLQDYDLAFHQNARPQLVRGIVEMRASFWSMSKKLSDGGSTVKFLAEALRSRSYDSAVERCGEFAALYNDLSRTADRGGYLSDDVARRCLTVEEREEVGTIRVVREDVPFHEKLAQHSIPPTDVNENRRERGTSGEDSPPAVPYTPPPGGSQKPYASDGAVEQSASGEGIGESES